MITHTAKRIFQSAVDDYHIKDRVDQPFTNPYDTEVDFLEHLLYRKAWIDTVRDDGDRSLDVSENAQ